MYRKFREVWTYDICDTVAERQTNTHTDTLIAVLRTLSGQSNNDNTGRDPKTVVPMDPKDFNPRLRFKLNA